jgi:metal-dependent amidase/aminoacylase/carboxypeptidase family protein
MAGIAADHLRAAAYEVTTEAGVVSLPRNGEGPAVMLRAGMDALPLRKPRVCPTPAEYRRLTAPGKTVFVMHACGHDMHVTWLIGATSFSRSLANARKGTLMAVFNRRNRPQRASRR